jgi:acyl-CoA thioester hydrolase
MTPEPAAASRAQMTNPDRYHHWTEVTLRFGDEDRMGHVNNAAYIEYFEASRVPFLEQFVDTGRIDFVLANISVDYLKETRFPGVVRVGACINKMGNKSVTTHYAIFRDETCLATATCVNVFFDTLTRTSSAPTHSTRARIEAHLQTFESC